MHPALVRFGWYPLHEKLLGRRTFAYLRELERTQWCAPDDLRELQRAKLRALLRHAHQTNRFYGRRFDVAGINPAEGDPFEILAHLPVLEKREIRGSLADMVGESSRGVVCRHTGGSTGEPLTFYVDRRRQAYDQAARLRAERWFGVDVGERQLYLWGSPIETATAGRVRRLRDALFNHRLLSAFDMSPRRMDGYLDEWNRFRPASLFGYPSSIALFVDHVRRRQRALDTSRLRAVFVTGEVCYPHQRAAIASFFGVPVADGYGSREAGFIAHQCAQGRMHQCSENVVIEVLDQGLRPLPPGETGEIVITHLDAFAMPFIRYRTGDVGRVIAGRCACGRGLPLMDAVQGRTTDFLRLPDGTIKHALAVIYPLREMQGVSGFRVEQRPDYSVTAELSLDSREGSVTIEAVTKQLKAVLGHEIDVRVEFVRHLPAAKSGKHRHVVSYVRDANGASSPTASAHASQ